MLHASGKFVGNIIKLVKSRMKDDEFKGEVVDFHKKVKGMIKGGSAVDGEGFKERILSFLST